jgi:hypothetical protein
MVAISKSENNFIFEVKGLHKLWALKNKITVSVDNIVSVHQNVDPLSIWQGLRFPGTHIPYVFAAGTFYRCGKKVFMDVFRKSKCIIVELKDSNYNQLIINVENPEEAMKTLGY